MPEVVWVAIIGAVAGLLAGLGGAYITVRAQAKQADRERWAHRRQEAYTDVIIAADDLADEISDWWVRGSAGLIHDADNDLPEPIKTTVKAAYDRASVRAELIASWRGSVKPRLDMLDAAAWSARFSTHGLEGQSRQEVVDAVEQARRDLSEARRRFTEAARRELGVHQEGVMGPWRTRWYKIRKRLRRPPRKPNPGPS